MKVGQQLKFQCVLYQGEMGWGKREGIDSGEGGEDGNGVVVRDYGERMGKEKRGTIVSREGR